jgi:hypothetical protein
MIIVSKSQVPQNNKLHQGQGVRVCLLLQCEQGKWGCAGVRSSRTPNTVRPLRNSIIEVDFSSDCKEDLGHLAGWGCDCGNAITCHKRPLGHSLRGNPFTTVFRFIM